MDEDSDEHSDAIAPEQEAMVEHKPIAKDAEVVFQHLVKTYQSKLYRFILKNIGNATDAEDLAQQAFVEAARAFETFRGESELSTWLFGIAMNIVRNYLSREPHRRYHFESDESLAETLVGAESVDTQLIRQQTLGILLNELDGLPDDMRDVLMLVAVEELSYEDAAVMLSIPIGTVRSRASRARVALRRRLQAEGIELDF